MTIYKFGNCFLNTLERRLIRDRRSLELTSRTFDVLQLLVERSGEIVTKNEILSKVWNGSFVEEGNLPVYISKLRQVLYESGSERFIETVQGTGYRLIAPTVSVSQEEWRNQLSGNRRRQTDKLPAGLAFDSIAVLPLQNESSNAEIDYLADGLTESFINSLSRIAELKVMARYTVFRYKNKDVDPKVVGETLGVSAVLTGRIKIINDRLLISVELAKVEDGSQLWGTQFNQPFSDIIKIQEEITLGVSESLTTEITRVITTATELPFTLNWESYRFYLKGKFFKAKRSESDAYRAIEYFMQSVSYDPSNVHSYAEAIECYLYLYIFDQISFEEISAKIRPLLKIVRGLNQSEDVVQNLYGGIKIYLEWDFSEAGDYLRRALAINPNNSYTHFRYSEYLLLSGRFSEASECIQKIMLIDPLSTLTYKRIARVLWKMGRHENAVVYLRDAIEVEAEDYEAHFLLGLALTELGEFDEALKAFQKTTSIHYLVETLSMIGYVHALAGRKDEALKIIEQIKSESKTGFNKRAVQLARIYAALGESAEAYRYLEEARDRREVDLRAISYDPTWKSIGRERRFKEFVLSLGPPKSKILDDTISNESRLDARVNRKG